MATITAKGEITITCHGDDVTGCLDDFANSVVIAIRDEQVACSIYCHVTRRIKGSFRGTASISTEAKISIACDGDDVTGSLDNFANSVITRIRNVQIAVGIHANTSWIVERSVCSCVAISTKPRSTISRYGDDVTSSLDDFANPVIDLINDKQIAEGIYGDTFLNGK